MSNYDTETMPSLRRDIAESLTMLGVGYPSAILAADLREQRDDQMDQQDAYDRIVELEGELQSMTDELTGAQDDLLVAQSKIEDLQQDLRDCDAL